MIYEIVLTAWLIGCYTLIVFMVGHWCGWCEAKYQNKGEDVK